jgi:hypothetical protein
MHRKWKIAIIVTALLLLAGTIVFAKADNQRVSFSLDESAWCGPRNSSGFGLGGCGGPGGYNGGGPDGSDGYGGGFSCH